MQGMPVYIDGKSCGSLKIYRDGLMTVFEAHCAAAADRPVRLYLFGGGKSALLGTLRPEDSGLGIVRRFSREELGRLPASVEYAADRELMESAADTLWRQGKMGCLIADGQTAIPADPARLGRIADRLRRIDGRTYLIFERKT